MLAFQSDPQVELPVATDCPRPKLGPSQVRVQVVAAGVNRADLLQCAGKYPLPAGTSSILGLECAGTIIESGIEVPNLPIYLPGARVCALVDSGAFAEEIVIPYHRLLPIPEHLSFAQAAALPEAAATVWSNLATSLIQGTFRLPGTATIDSRVSEQRTRKNHRGTETNDDCILKPDTGKPTFLESKLRTGVPRWILILGGSGGIGSFAIQVARAYHWSVIATAGNDSRCQKVADLGADYVFNHHQLSDGELIEKVRAATDDLGVGLVLDPLGTKTDRLLKMMAPDGEIKIIGLQAGNRCQYSVARQMGRRISISASTLRARPNWQKDLIISSVYQCLWPYLNRQQLRPIVGLTAPIQELNQVFDAMKNGEVFGKAVVYLPAAQAN